MTHTILIVDDDENILSSMKRSLRNENYEVLCASNAEEAFGLLRKNVVDLIVSDQDMPGMQGIEFLKKTIHEFPEVVRFVLTGNATLDVAIQAINEGAVTRFFAKPCNIVDLVVSIRQSLEHKALLHQSKRLLQSVKSKNKVLKQLENEHPGITKVKRDHAGNILVDKIPDDFQSFLLEINQALEDEQ